MKSKKDNRERKGGTDLVGALRELAEQIEATPAEAVPLELGRAMRRVLSELDEAGVLAGGDDGAAEPPALGSVRQREEAGLSAKLKKPERHDKRRKIPGYTYVEPEGMLYEDERQMEATPELASMAASLLSNLALMIKAPVGAGVSVPLFAKLGDFHEWVGDGGKLAEHAEEIRAAYEAFFGHPHGERWIRALRELLHMNAYHRKADELRELHSDELPAWVAKMSEVLGDEEIGPAFAVKTPEQILNALRETEGDLPEELTVDAIREMDGRVGLNAGGRAGLKTAGAVVDEFFRGMIRARGNSPR